MLLYVYTEIGGELFCEFQNAGKFDGLAALCIFVEREKIFPVRGKIYVGRRKGVGSPTYGDCGRY